MKNLSMGIVLGLIIGMIAGWVIWGLNKENTANNTPEVNEISTQSSFATSEIQKIFISKDTAGRYVRNYLKRKKGLNKTESKENTTYLTISTQKLVDLINLWHGGEERLTLNPSVPSQVDSIRIYPMIYARNHPNGDGGKNVKNMLNLCLVPVFQGNEILQRFNNKDGYFFFRSIENQIGQCPPGTCRTDLLKYVATLSSNPDSD